MGRKRKVDSLPAPTPTTVATRAETFSRRARATTTASAVTAATVIVAPVTPAPVTAAKRTRSRAALNRQAGISTPTTAPVPDPVDNAVEVLPPLVVQPVITGTGRRKSSTNSSNRGRGARSKNFNAPVLDNKPTLNSPSTAANKVDDSLIANNSNTNTFDHHSELNWNIPDEVLQLFPLVPVSDSDYASTDQPQPTSIIPITIQSTSADIATFERDIDDNSDGPVSYVIALPSPSEFVSLNENDNSTTPLPTHGIQSDEDSKNETNDVMLSNENQNDSGDNSASENHTNSDSVSEITKPSESSLYETSDLLKHLTGQFVQPTPAPPIMLIDSKHPSAETDDEENNKTSDPEEERKLFFVSSDRAADNGEHKKHSAWNDHDSDDLDSLTVLHDPSMDFHSDGQAQSNDSPENATALFDEAGTSALVPVSIPTSETSNVETSDTNSYQTCPANEIPHHIVCYQSPSEPTKTGDEAKLLTSRCVSDTQQPNLAPTFSNEHNLETESNDKLENLQPQQMGSDIPSGNSSIQTVLAVVDTEFSDGESVKIITLSESDDSINKDESDNLQVAVKHVEICTGEINEEERAESELSQNETLPQQNHIQLQEVVSQEESTNTERDQCLQSKEKLNDVNVAILGKRERRSCSDTDTASETEKAEKMCQLPFDKDNVSNTAYNIEPVDSHAIAVDQNLKKLKLENQSTCQDNAEGGSNLNLNHHSDENCKGSDGKEPQISQDLKAEKLTKLKNENKTKKSKPPAIESDTHNDSKARKLKSEKPISKIVKSKQDASIEKKPRGRPRLVKPLAIGPNNEQGESKSHAVGTKEKKVGKPKGRPRTISDSPECSGATKIEKKKEYKARSKSLPVVEELNSEKDDSEAAIAVSGSTETKEGNGEPQPGTTSADSIEQTLGHEGQEPGLEKDNSVVPKTSTIVEEGQKAKGRGVGTGIVKKSVEGKKKKVSPLSLDQLEKSSSRPPKSPSKSSAKKTTGTLKQQKQQQEHNKSSNKNNTDSAERENDEESSAQSKPNRLLWYYNQEQKNILYTDSAFLAMRGDLNKEGKIYLWRIMKKYKMVRKFVPIEIDGRQCHFGVDEFRHFETEDSLVCEYQPVIFTMIVDTPKFQIGIYYNTIKHLHLLAYFPSTNHLFAEFNIFLRHMTIRAMTDDEQIKPENDVHGGPIKSAVEVIETHLGRILQDIMFGRKWPREILMCILEYPNINKTRKGVTKSMNCIACSNVGRTGGISAFKLLFHGECYDASTLVLTHKAGPQMPDDAQFCYSCPGILRSLHSLIHYKYWVFVTIRMQLQQLYQALKPGESYKAKQVFDFIVGDFEWVNTMFYEFQATLAEGTQALEKTQRQKKQMERKEKTSVKNDSGVSKKLGRPRRDSSASGDCLPPHPPAPKILKKYSSKKAAKNDKNGAVLVELPESFPKKTILAEPALPTESGEETHPQAAVDEGILEKSSSLDNTHLSAELPCSETPEVSSVALDTTEAPPEAPPEALSEAPGQVIPDPARQGNGDEESEVYETSKVVKEKKRSSKELNSEQPDPEVNNKNEELEFSVNSEQGKKIQQGIYDAIRRAAIPPLNPEPSVSSESETDEPEPSSFPLGLDIQNTTS